MSFKSKIHEKFGVVGRRVFHFRGSVQNYDFSAHVWKCLKKVEEVYFALIGAGDHTAFNKGGAWSSYRKRVKALLAANILVTGEVTAWAVYSSKNDSE
ncbi:MAG: hypothetical protein ACI8ZB_000240 [Desulforhopalus sp.]